jgi:DAK2 domain fusion protein YloV
VNALTSLEVGDVERALRLYCDALAEHREALNALNVYPVPDGDTGTNMSLTLRSVVAEIDGAGVGPADRWNAISHGSLMGARGNSGVIMSQILRGLCGALSEVATIEGPVLATALTHAAEAAYGAVMRPVEGTILTVVRESAAAATTAADSGTDLAATIAAAAEEAAASLERTPELLPVLADAGVVDAGGAGYLLFLQSLRCVVDSTPVPPAPRSDEMVRAATVTDADAETAGDFRYEVMFLLDADDASIDDFKAVWADLGDSIVVVGGDGLWNCHVHSNDIGGCIEAGIAVGRPHRIRVTDLFEEVEHVEELSASDGGGITITEAGPSTTAVIAVAAGEGVQRIFESLGVHAVVRGGQSMNPSTGQILEAARSVSSDQVVILPNNKNIIPVAEQVDSQIAKKVTVVPTRSIAEGFASLLAFDPDADADTNREAMAGAAEAVVAGEVTQAVRESQTAAGHVTEGDWIGLDRSGVRSIASSAATAAVALLERLIDADHELVTVIAGEGASESAVEAVTAWLTQERPDVEFEVHQGGQPLYAFYFGIE